MPASKSVFGPQSIFRNTVRNWLEQSYQWRIPVYQRHYSWDANDEFGPTQLFWEVVESQAVTRINAQKRHVKPPPPHYFGAILVEEKSDPLGLRRYDVVDGQQRLTTLNVALFSLIGLAKQKGHSVKDELAQYIFTNDKERKDPKLLPTNYDQAQYFNLLKWAYQESTLEPKKPKSKSTESMVIRACHYFNQRLKDFVESQAESENDDIAIPLRALQETLLDGFEFVVIPLSKTDEAQKVFEAMNNAARPLTTFDLIRNDIFYRADKEAPELDETLFNSSTWQQFEDPFWEYPFNKAKGEKHVEEYIRRMLIAKQKKFLILNLNAIYREYKNYAREFAKGTMTAVESEIKDISEYVHIYKHIVGEEHSEELADIDFGYFKSHYKNTSVFLPVMFVIATSDATVREKNRMIKLLESWYLRRNICELVGDYNKQAPSLCAKLAGGASYVKVHAFLKESEGDTRKFPRDAEIETALSRLNFHSNNLVHYVFARIVGHTTTENRNEVRDIKGWEIDHILPQGWRERPVWKDVLKISEDSIVDAKLNTIGNLTPLAKGTNAQKSNLPWILKDGEGARDILLKSDLTMTREIADKNKESWGITEIDERTKKLVNYICEIWPEEIA